MSRVLVIDCLNQMFALHHCNVRNKTATFLKDLRTIITETEANKVILGCDFGKSAFRLKRLPTYKSDRYKRREEQSDADKEKLEEFFKEVTEFQDNVAPLFGIDVVKFKNVEFDDIAAEIVNNTDLTDNQIFLLSSDKDLNQLLRKNVVQRSAYFKIKLGKGYLPPKVWLNRGRFVTTYEINPPQLADVKALAGDAGDSVVSPKGLGAETAMKLIRKYNSIDGVEANLVNIKKDIPKVSQKVIDSLTENFDLIRSNYEIVNLNYGPEIRDEIFNKEAQASLNETIANFGTPSRVDKAAIEDYLLEKGEINLLTKLDDWLRPFYGAH